MHPPRITMHPLRITMHPPSRSGLALSGRGLAGLYASTKPNQEDKGKINFKLFEIERFKMLKFDEINVQFQDFKSLISH